MAAFLCIRSPSSSPQVANPSQGEGLEVQSDMSLDPRDSVNSVYRRKSQR